VLDVLGSVVEVIEVVDVLLGLVGLPPHDDEPSTSGTVQSHRLSLLTV
jgi:hypothetical protein